MQQPVEMSDLDTSLTNKDASPPTTAISPSTTTDPSTSSPVDPSIPAAQITLLLSNSNRHAYRIDNRYLTRRGVTVEDGDPFNLTVYQMKELIMRDWRTDWEAKPTAPNFIRLIFMGGMLNDNTKLKGTSLLSRSETVKDRSALWGHLDLRRAAFEWLHDFTLPLLTDV